MSLPVPVIDSISAGCFAAVFLCTVACATVLGSSVRTLLEDILMVVLTEGTARLAIRSPLDWIRPYGKGMSTWTLVAGTGLAMVGILLNHLALRSGPRKHRMG